MRYLTLTETARLVRDALRAAFPGVKFGIRCVTTSMTQSIVVKWTDGPTPGQVEEVTDRYVAMDSDDGVPRYRDSTLIARADGDVQNVRFGAGRIDRTRVLSPGYRADLERIAANLLASAGIEYGDQWTDSFATSYGSWPGGPADCMPGWLSERLTPARAASV